MNPLYNIAFGIAPQLMCLSYHHQQSNYKETELFRTQNRRHMDFPRGNAMKLRLKLEILDLCH